MRVFCSVFWLSILASAVCSADEAPAKQQTPLEAAYSQQRELYSKYRALEQQVTDNSELKKLRQAAEDATAALEAKTKNLTVKERQTEEEARKQLNAAIEQKIASSPEITRLQEKREAMERQARKLRFEIGLTSVYLYHRDSPAQQALDADEELQKLKTPPKSSKTEERLAAYRKYNAARREKLKTLKEARQHFDKIAELERQITEIEQERYAAWNKINETKRNIQFGKEPSLQPLRDKLEAARTATRKAAYTEKTKDLREAASQANLAYRKKYSELISSSEELTQLKTQLDAVYKKIKQLRSEQTPPTTAKPDQR